MIYRFFPNYGKQQTISLLPFFSLSLIRNMVYLANACGSKDAGKTNGDKTNSKELMNIIQEELEKKSKHDRKRRATGEWIKDLSPPL